jgi:hypothetical protein
MRLKTKNSSKDIADLRRSPSFFLGRPLAATPGFAARVCHALAAGQVDLPPPPLSVSEAFFQALAQMLGLVPVYASQIFCTKWA